MTLFPLIAWKRPHTAHEMPTKRLLIAWKRPLSAWKRLRNADTIRESSSNSEFLVRMGVIIFETHYTSFDKWLFKMSVFDWIITENS